MCDPLDDIVWLFRGVPIESREVKDVRATGEIEPPVPANHGEHWRHLHSMGDNTQTAYTSWTSERSIAVDAADAMADRNLLSGQKVIFRVRSDSIPLDRVFDGRADEYEYLILGVIENVERSDGDEDDV